MLSLVQFLVNNYKSWERYEHIFDNRLFNFLLGKTFNSIEEFIVDYVKQGNNVDWYHLCMNPNITEKNL